MTTPGTLSGSSGGDVTPAPGLRILVSGSRDWTDYPTIETTLAGLRPPELDPDQVVVVHGGCRGADRLAAAAAKVLGYQAQAFLADWDAYPNQPWKAAHDRNQRMIGQGLPQVAVVFKDGFDLHLRRGGSEDTYRRCVAAGIPSPSLPASAPAPRRAPHRRPHQDPFQKGAASPCPTTSQSWSVTSRMTRSCVTPPTVLP